MTAPKVLLIFFDGAEWNVIEPLLRAGRLPNLAALMEAGTYGRLRSLEDVALASPILWTSMASGKRPHKHGVRSFYDTADSVQCVRLWEIFEQEQLPIGLFRYLITWPPRSTNGFIVPDWCARTPEAFPPTLTFINTLRESKGWRDLATNAVRAVRHGMRFPTAVLALKEAAREKLLKPLRLDSYHSQRLLELAIHTDLFIRLLRRYQPYFTVFYTGLPDAFHHQYWKFMEPDKFPGVSPSEVARYGAVIPCAYEQLDRTLRRLLREAGPDTLVVVASDHGGEANVEEEYRWADIRTEEFLKALGLTGTATAFRIGTRTHVQWQNGSPPELSVPQVAERLSKATLVGSSSPIFRVETSDNQTMAVEVVYLKESMEGAELVFPDGRRFPAEQLLNLTPSISGKHSMDGILLLRGPHVKKDFEIAGANLLDVTPTILALLGRPIGKDMDGRVLTDAIESEFLDRHPVQSIESYDLLLGKRPTAPLEDPELGLAEVKQRLQDLGYID